MTSREAAAATPVAVLAVATAVPEHLVPQDVARESARKLFGPRMRDFDRLSDVFRTTGVETRYSVRPVPWFFEPHGWPERTAAYLEGAGALFRRVATEALAKAGLVATDVDVVVTVSSTGVTTPSLEARELPALGFRSDVARVPVFGLGCAGGVTGLGIASRLASSRPGTTVLLIAVELCTLAFRLDRATKADVIATSLFGDGAAAAVLTSRTDLAPLAHVTGATEHLWPETLDIMGWAVDDVGLGVLLSRSLPAFVERRYRIGYQDALARLDYPASDVGRVVCHPGGTKVLEAIEAALDVPRGHLVTERGVMRDYGNMSSPTVLFVLERALAEGLPAHTMLAALGPGFTASFVALDGAGARAELAA